VYLGQDIKTKDYVAIKIEKSLEDEVKSLDREVIFRKLYLLLDINSQSFKSFTLNSETLLVWKGWLTLNYGDLIIGKRFDLLSSYI